MVTHGSKMVARFKTQASGTGARKNSSPRSQSIGDGCGNVRRTWRVSPPPLRERLKWQGGNANLLPTCTCIRVPLYQCIEFFTDYEDDITELIMENKGVDGLEEKMCNVCFKIFSFAHLFVPLSHHGFCSPVNPSQARTPNCNERGGITGSELSKHAPFTIPKGPTSLLGGNLLVNLWAKKRPFFGPNVSHFCVLNGRK